MIRSSLRACSPVTAAIFTESREPGARRRCGESFQRPLKKRFDHRRLVPAFIHEGQTGFFDQSTLPVVVGNGIERCQAEAVRQAQVVQPTGIVKRTEVGPGAARSYQDFAEHPCRMLGLKGLGVDARRKEQQGVQAAREVLVQSLAEILQVILGKIVLYGRKLVFRQRVAERIADEDVPAR